MIGRLGLAGLILASAVASSCAARRGAPPPRPIGGTLYLYLEAVPKDAPRISLTLASIEAVDQGGAFHSIDILERTIASGEADRQRLIAAGELPPGRYAGLRVAFVAARVEEETHPRDLVVSEEPASIERAFSVAEDGAAMLSLRFEPEGSIAEGIRFEPSLTASGPGTLAGGLYGLTVGRTDNALILFHKLSGEVFGVLRTGVEPKSVVLDVARQLAFVANAGNDTVDVFDLVRMARDQRFPLLAGDEPSALALSRDGTTLACAHRGSNVVGVYDAPVLAERFRVPVGLEPSALVLDAEGRLAYVVNTGSDTIVSVDLAAGKARRTVATEDAPVHAALDRLGKRLYVIHRGSPYLLAISLPQLVVDRRVYVGPGASTIAVDPRTDRVFVARRDMGGVDVFDPASLLAVDRIDTGGDVSFLAVSRDGDILYAAVPRTREVIAIRLSGYGRVATTEIAGEPVWIAPAGER